MHTHTPLPTGVFDDVNTPIACINTTDIGRSISYSLEDIAKRSTIPYKNVPLLYFEGGGGGFI